MGCGQSSAQPVQRSTDTIQTNTRRYTIPEEKEPNPSEKTGEQYSTPPPAFKSLEDATTKLSLAEDERNSQKREDEQHVRTEASHRAASRYSVHSVRSQRDEYVESNQDADRPVSRGSVKSNASRVNRDEPEAQAAFEQEPEVHNRVPSRASVHSVKQAEVTERSASRASNLNRRSARSVRSVREETDQVRDCEFEPAVVRSESRASIQSKHSNRHIHVPVEESRAPSNISHHVEVDPIPPHLTQRSESRASIQSRHSNRHVPDEELRASSSHHVEVDPLPPHLTQRSESRASVSSKSSNKKFEVIEFQMSTRRLSVQSQNDQGESSDVFITEEKRSQSRVSTSSKVNNRAEEATVEHSNHNIPRSASRSSTNSRIQEAQNYYEPHVAHLAEPEPQLEQGSEQETTTEQHEEPNNIHNNTNNDDSAIVLNNESDDVPDDNRNEKYSEQNEYENVNANEHNTAIIHDEQYVDSSAYDQIATNNEIKNEETDGEAYVDTEHEQQDVAVSQFNGATAGEDEPKQHNHSHRQEDDNNNNSNNNNSKNSEPNADD